MMRKDIPAVSDLLQAPGVYCRLGCPYFDLKKKICCAATGLLNPGADYQADYCTSDDYDDCPLYLCQALRSSQALGLDRESITQSGK